MCACCEGPAPLSLILVCLHCKYGEVTKRFRFRTVIVVWADASLKIASCSRLDHTVIFCACYQTISLLYYFQSCQNYPFEFFVFTGVFVTVRDFKTLLCAPVTLELTIRPVAMLESQQQVSDVWRWESHNIYRENGENYLVSYDIYIRHYIAGGQTHAGFLPWC
jgi:hypothetical protein